MCEYCENNKEIKSPFSNDDFGVFIKGCKMEIHDIVEEYTYNKKFVIWFCPMCGADLMNRCETPDDMKRSIMVTDWWSSKNGK